MEFKRDNISMKSTRLELYHGSFVNDLIQILSFLLWKLVKRLLFSVQARTRTIKGGVPVFRHGHRFLRHRHYMKDQFK